MNDANKHCILETSRGTYTVESFREGADGQRHEIVAAFATPHLELARNVAKSRASEFGGTWHDAPGY